MKKTIEIKNITKNFTVLILTLVLIFVTVFQIENVGNENTFSYAATTYKGAWEGNDAPTPLQSDQDPTDEAKTEYGVPNSYAWPYPWSRNAEATGDWVRDSYGLTAEQSAKFEPVSVDRLADVLTRDKENHYILFATPRSKAGQKLVKAIATVENKINKIYLFNPVLDDYQLDIFDKEGIGKISDGGSGHNLKDTWTYIKGLLANGGVKNLDATTDSPYEAVDFGNITSKTAVFFSTTQNAPSLTEDNASNSLVSYRAISAGAVVEVNEEPSSTAIQNVLTFGNSGSTESSEITNFDFFRRYWNAAITSQNSGQQSTSKIGTTASAFLNIFPTGDEYNSL
ncbi:MAG: hypothetical protein LBD41_05850, partial [Clostridiales Family XIII bacterium]|nr:hypothetical protein [Clostridiales Family XIII bacterium]